MNISNEYTSYRRAHVAFKQPARMDGHICCLATTGRTVRGAGLRFWSTGSVSGGTRSKLLGELSGRSWGDGPTGHTLGLAPVHTRRDTGH